MIKRTVLGDELWVCTTKEARQLWVSNPEDRWRIWTDEEWEAHRLDDADMVANNIQSKKAKPGKLNPSL